MMITQSALPVVRQPHADTAPGAATPPLAGGLVLAMHFLPADRDPLVEGFWSRLATALAARGHALILLSTTPVADPALQTIDVPFEITAFVQRFPRHPARDIAIGEEETAHTASWYRCSRQAARDNLHVAHAFVGDLLHTLRPAAVLGWQDLVPLTRVVREQARAAGIPYWAGERGWVRNTLLFDLAGTHALGETYASLASRRQRRHYQPKPEVLRKLRHRATHAASLDRYPAAVRTGREALLRKLGVPPNAPVAVLFTHCEPGINAISAPAPAELHDARPEVLQQRIDAVTAALLARGFWLLVQEHPLNIKAGRCLKLPGASRVLSVHENVSSLLDACDLSLYTLASLQFDAIFLDKPLGLLSRSALYHDGEPPFMGDYATADTFLDAVLDSSAWPERHRCTRAHVAFYYEELLLDIEPTAVDASAAEWADHLAQFKRPVGCDFPGRVELFLADWG